MDRRFGTDRGLSPAVGMVVIVGMVAAGGIMVAVAGSGVLGSVQDEATNEQATASMDHVASELQGSGETAATFPDEGTAYVDPDAGSISVELRNESRNANLTVIDESLGAIYYEHAGTTVAYQAGGVWRSDASGRSTMERPPPIQYVEHDSPTLVLPVTTVEGPRGRVDGERLQTTSERVFPNEVQKNPVVNDTLVVEIESEFYRAWAAYLDDELNASVVAHDGTVRAELNTSEIDPPSAPASDAGLDAFAFNEGEMIDVNNDVMVDSYDSAEGAYDDADPGSSGNVKSKEGTFQLSNDGTIHGDVDAVAAELSGDVAVYGDVTVGSRDDTTLVSGHWANGMVLDGEFSTKSSLSVSSDVYFGGDVIVGGDLESFDGTIDGDLYVHGDAKGHDGEVHGDVVVGGTDSLSGDVDVSGTVTERANASELREPKEPDLEVSAPEVDVGEVVEEIRKENNNDNDNPGGSAVRGHSNTLKQNCPSVCELGAGEYYLDNLTMTESEGPDRLRLNTTEGPVRIAVDGPARLDGTELEVVYDTANPQPATFYVTEDFDVDGGATVEIADDFTPALEVFMEPEARWRIEGGSTWRGVVYGQSDGSSRTEVELSGNEGTEFYGAVMGDVTDVSKTLGYHYDEALGYGRVTEYDPDDLDDTTADLVLEDTDVSYLHVEHERVRVD